jgi:alkylation response protein AidB-like acyl-CoA dehydrogenase
MAQPTARMTPASRAAVDCAAVDFDLSADQQALQGAAAALLDGLAGHDALRARVGRGAVVGTLPGAGTGAGAGDAGQVEPAAAADSDVPRGYDEAVWAAMTEQGWQAIEVPEEDGGLGLGMVEIAVLCEEVGRRLVAAPYLSSVVALGALCTAEARAETSTKEWREGLSEGALVGCTSFVARQGVLAVDGSRSGSQVRLRGELPPTVYAASADVAIVVTADAVYGVDLRVLGKPAPVSAMDRTRELGVLRFTDTAAVRLGAAEAAQGALDRGAVLSGAEMLGAADQVLAMSVQYAKDRVQFGKPIGSFQAVKHMLADAVVDVEGMRSAVYYAAWCAAAEDDDRSLAASMAKAWCSDASRRVMATGLQVHGGIGFTWEHDMHLFVKRAQLDQVSFGDAAFHRDRIASMLRERLDNGQTLT